MRKVLFICKRGGIYGGVYGEYSSGKQSSGLKNSAAFMVRMLSSHGVPARLVEITDNNDIDREVTAYRPTHVIIEALWVVPAKFEVLQRLHPRVRWVVRIHSEMPFLAQEGSAMEWICGYLARGIEVAPNSRRATTALRELVPDGRVRYLPNYYPAGHRLRMPPAPPYTVVNIGCFGAVRPFKNQLMQAIAAISFARSRGLGLRFHMNGTRMEQGGSPVLKNIVTLFSRGNVRLHLHPWLSHREFTRLVRGMDVGMQVSFSETFNIVAADFAARGVPVVVSPEISWARPEYQAEPTSLGSIERALEIAYDSRRGLLPVLNFLALRQASREAAGIWLRWLGGAAPWGVA